MTLANLLVGKGWERSEAMKESYKFVRENPKAKVLKFYKKNDAHNQKLVTRVVHKNIVKFQALKGGATTNYNPKFIDVVKVLTGESFRIISAIESKIVSLVA